MGMIGSGRFTHWPTDSVSQWAMSGSMSGQGMSRSVGNEWASEPVIHLLLVQWVNEWAGMSRSVSQWAGPFDCVIQFGGLT